MLAGVVPGSMGRTILLAALAAAVLLVAAPAALAKGPLQVCGASGCAVLGPEGQSPIGLGDRGGTLAPPAPAPYYVVRFSGMSVAAAYWIPSVSVLRLFTNGPAVWVAALPAEEAVLRAQTAGLQPYPAPKHVAAFVDDGNVRAGDTYLRLYTIGTPVVLAPPASTEWLGIWLHGGTSPWTDGMSSFWISKKGSLLKRDDHVLQIPPALAKRIRAHLPLS